MLSREGEGEGKTTRNTRHKYHKVRRSRNKSSCCITSAKMSCISVSVLLAAVVVVASLIVVVVEHSKNNSGEK